MLDKSLEEKVEEKFENAFRNTTAVNPVFPYAAKQQMAQMVEEIAANNGALKGILNTDQTSFAKGGFAAEEWHAHGFNLDAILKDSENRAQPLRTTDPAVDIIISDNHGNVIKSAQAKFYKNAKDTAGALSEVVDGRAKYGDNESLIAPGDQIDDIKTQSLNNLAKNRARNGDPSRREAYQQTHDKVTDTLTDGEASSRPLTKKEANSLGRGNVKKIRQLDREYQTASTLNQMGKAAAGAAALSAVVSGTVNTIRYVQLAREGKISADEAVVKIVAETAASAADCAVKVGANVGVQSLMVRSGAEKVVIQSLAKQGLTSMVKTNAVTVGVVCAVDAVKDLVGLGMGKITKEQFYERQGKGILNTSATVTGGSLGVASVGAAVASAPAWALAAGGIAGGLIAGLAMQMAIENGIEKPYRDLVRNTGALREAAQVLEQTSQTVFAGQVFFTKFIEADTRGERVIQEQFSRIDAAGQNALNLINQI